MKEKKSGETQLLAIEKLLNIMAELREKCPWDKKQTIKSIRHLTIEEVFELSEAIIDENTKAIQEELGDLLLHIVFYAQIGSENDDFDIESIANTVCQKLIKRHPHIYGNKKVYDEETVKKNWEKIKLEQKKLKGEKISVLNGVPKGLPPLIQAYRLQEKAKGVGFDWDNSNDVWKKVKEEISELETEIINKTKSENQTNKIQYEFGDLLFSLVNMARHTGINPEEALYQTNAKFKKRFSKMEDIIATSNRNIFELSLEEMEKCWQTAKSEEKK